MSDVRLHFLVIELPADETLEPKDGVGGVDNTLSLGRKTDETLAVLGEGHDGRSRASTLRVFYHTRNLALHDGNARVCRAQVNANDWARDLAVHVACNEATRDLLQCLRDICVSVFLGGDAEDNKRTA